MNYTQSNLTAPMHFDRKSWMEATNIGMGGSMDFTIRKSLDLIFRPFLHPFIH